MPDTKLIHAVFSGTLFCKKSVLGFELLIKKIPIFENRKLRLVERIFHAYCTCKKWTDLSILSKAMIQMMT